MEDADHQDGIVVLVHSLYSSSATVSLGSSENGRIMCKLLSSPSVAVGAVHPLIKLMVAGTV